MFKNIFESFRINLYNDDKLVVALTMWKPEQQKSVNKEELKKIPMDGVVEQLILACTATSYLYCSSIPHRLLDKTILFADLSLFWGFCGSNSVSDRWYCQQTSKARPWGAALFRWIIDDNVMDLNRGARIYMLVCIRYVQVWKLLAVFLFYIRRKSRAWLKA